MVQYDNNFYLILDNHLQRVGILNNNHHGATPFYNDLITQQIADNDQQLSISSVQDNLNTFDPNGNTKSWGHTLNSIYIPYGYSDTKLIREGYHLAYQDPNNYHWYVMRITTVTDSIDSSGNHYKEAMGVNLLIWKLGKTIHYPAIINHANSKEAFNALLADTGWYLDPEAELVGGSSDIEFDGISSNQSFLQQFCRIYGAEIDAYVQFGEYDWDIVLKRVDVKRHLGRDTGQRVMYGRNITNISRSTVDDSLYTKLFVYGKGGATCACALTDDNPFVKDDVANKIYSPSLNDEAANYLEGAITSSTMKDPVALYQWGLKQLKLFNHPRANYTVSVSQDVADSAGDNIVFKANLGDTIRIIDLVMDPELTVESRVISKQLSFANPDQNNITLGEYVTVNVVPPSFIRNLRQGVDNHLAELLDELRRNPNALSCVIDKPDGTSWGKNDKVKKFIAHVSIMGEDISPYIKPQGYEWNFYPNKSNNSSVIDKAGNADDEFYENHKDSGQTLLIKNDEAAAGEIRLTIDTGFIVDDPEVDFDINDLSEQFTVKHWRDEWGDDRVGALQFINYNNYDNYYYSSLVYYGSQRPKENGHLIGSGNGKHTCTIHSEIARLNDKGYYQDSMILLFSHHNGSFGLQSASNNTYIWTTVEDFYHNRSNHNKRYWLVRIPYLPGEVITPNDSRYQKILSYSEPSVMAYYDQNSNKVMLSHDSNKYNPQHEIDIYDADDLLNKGQSAKTQRQFNLIDYGFAPKNNDGSDKNISKQTYQSGCLKYPYFFFTSGNVNMSDPRMIYCINVQTETMVFKQELVLDNFNLGNYIFGEPETINWTLENNNPVFLFGMNIATYNDKEPNKVVRAADDQYHQAHEHIEKLWRIGFKERDNSKHDGGDIPINEEVDKG